MSQFRRRLSLVLWFAALLGAAGEATAGGDIFVRAADDGSVQLSNVPDAADYQLLLAAPVAPAPIAAAASASAPDAAAQGSGMQARVSLYHDLVDQAAKHAKVDARLVHAVIAVESGYNPTAVSRKGAIGLMQLMPETARRYGARNSRDPGQNVRAGAMYLADLLKMFDNDVHLALAAYNAGERAVLRHGSRIPPYRETTAYVPKVLAVYSRLKTLSI
jgi:soluble lytic murein transglycosylase-like protein